MENTDNSEYNQKQVLASAQEIVNNTSSLQENNPPTIINEETEIKPAPAAENYTRGYKLNVYNWLDPHCSGFYEFVEVRFKNSRKNFFRNTHILKLEAGDIVVTNAESGHDIGIVTLTGELVKFQMKKKSIKFDEINQNIIYRKARDYEIKKWKEAIDSEISIMLRARKITKDMKLDMKICDVECQGDKTRATFYFTADTRIDFRELIKVFAKEFKVKIEMYQIGARQETSLLGGIGPCGRELCCATWNNNSITINLSAARAQQLTLNPVKLSGQCGKLKCCLHYELECYEEALKDFPSTEINLETADGTAIFQKLDVYKRLMYYSYKHKSDELLVIPLEKVKEIIELNKKGVKPQVNEYVEKKKGIINYDDADNGTIEQWNKS